MKTPWLLPLLLAATSGIHAAVPNESDKVSVLQAKLGMENGVFVRRAAADALGKAGQEARSAVPALLKALTEDRDATVRHNAAWALGKSGSSDGEVIDALVKALRDPGWTVRHNAALSLTWIGKPAISALKAALADADPSIVIGAVKALVGIDPAFSEDSASALSKVLAHNSPSIRQEAAIVAGRFDARGVKAVPALIALLNDEIPDTRKNAIEALRSIGQPASEAVSPLLRVLQQDKDRWNRITAALALGTIGNDRAEVLEGLTKALGDKDARVRSYASNALAQMGAIALPTLQTLTASEESRMRHLAASALGLMGPAARGATGSLLPLLRDPDEQVRLAAVGALALIGNASDEVKTALEKARDTLPEDGDFRAPYVQALAMLTAKSAQ